MSTFFRAKNWQILHWLYDYFCNWKTAKTSWQILRGGANIYQKGGWLGSNLVIRMRLNGTSKMYWKTYKKHEEQSIHSKSYEISWNGTEAFISLLARGSPDSYRDPQDPNKKVSTIETFLFGVRVYKINFPTGLTKSTVEVRRSKL